MTSREARTARREAERKAAKLAYKAAKAAGAEIGFVSQAAEKPAEGPLPKQPGFVSQTAAQLFRRAETNRRNAQHSTGPQTVTGKAASSRNSLKHGLASGELIIPGEDRAAFEALLEDLLEEHQPASPTEELLVKEMAQSYWLTQRAIRFQNECFTGDGVDEKRLALFLRYQTTHERAFHKALNAIVRLKKERTRGSVSQNAPKRPDTGFVSHSGERPADEQPGFLSQNTPTALPEAA